jgi:rhamnose utilization protein RhaD (predicted bifunctional aldolase and dehydrogenase)/NAD(P)-dependent dehydrogenase (short-subunit alcohol dehydrogenase family)
MQLDELITISKLYGNNKDYTIASGGNTSVKNDEVMYVKASGYELGKIGEEGYVALDRGMLDRLKAKNYSENPQEREEQVKSDLLKSRLFPELNQRPSVEASVHHAIRFAYVVHMHPTYANAVLCSNKAQQTTNELFGDEVVFIPNIEPGLILYREIERQNEDYFSKKGRYPQVFFLQNHGVFVGAETTAEIRQKYDWIIETIRAEICNDIENVRLPANEQCVSLLPAVRSALSTDGLKLARFRRSSIIDLVLENDDELHDIQEPFTPDGMIFCGRKPLIVEKHDSTEETLEDFKGKLKVFRSMHGCDPKIVAVRGIGIIAPGSNLNAANIALDVFEDILKIAHLSSNFGGPHHLPAADIAFIESWEVESYRKSLIDRQGGVAPLTNKIAAVTGGAQGFGRGIVEGLLKEGALVQLIDWNAEVGEKTAKAFEQRGYKGKVIFAQADVSDAKGIADAAKGLVMAFGGVDLLVSNAGVLKAGALDELSEKDFDFVTKVNFKGYYQCVVHYAKPMKIQHAFNPKMYMDIVQINSKSGLEGSRKNFAYAGGKFGGIGLTQSFALELVQWNIKVNSICPGNYFEGPLWSDEEHGLFVQYLRAGKVPGAKSVDDVKEYYESRVPMNRGCQPADVVKAIGYLIHQTYETGQALPVTGGQVMLN